MINVQQLTAQVLLKGGAILVIFPCFSVQFTNTPASGQQASMAKEISQILLTHRQCWGSESGSAGSACFWAYRIRIRIH